MKRTPEPPPLVSMEGLLTFVEHGDPAAVDAYRSRLAALPSDVHDEGRRRLRAAMDRRLVGIVHAVEARVRAEVGEEAARAHRSGLAELAALAALHGGA